MHVWLQASGLSAGSGSMFQHGHFFSYYTAHKSDKPIYGHDLDVALGDCLESSGVHRHSPL